jgi:predicted methyltransferase MtxX (methanogen marker protein 4)
MSVMERYLNSAIKSPPEAYTIGIGLGEYNATNKNIWVSAKEICKKTGQNVIIIGTKDSIINDLPSLMKSPKNLDYISTNTPSQLLLDLIFTEKEIVSLRKNKIRKLDAIVRGGLSSAIFLKCLKEHIRNENNKDPEALTTGYGDLKRLALLETANGHQFYFAPVGIDEATTLSQRREFLSELFQFFDILNTTPKYGILSAGRSGDLGRDAKIDLNIKDTEALLNEIQEKNPNIEIKHFQILIEEAISQKMGVILAPDGISGNLIYRTLVHLGAGKSYGAVYLGCFNSLSKIIIDTSRIAPQNEYHGALVFALGLSVIKNKRY